VATKILKCDCVSDYQDEKYGKGNRMHNLTKDGGTRCSVCGTKKVGGVAGGDHER